MAEATNIEKVLRIPIPKAKGFIDIDLEKLPIEVYGEALFQGLKEIMARNMTKHTGLSKLDGEPLANAQAAVMAQAEKNLKDCYEGTIRLSGKAKTKKASGAVMTEARRLARILVKAELKTAGEKVSHYDAKEITKAANEILASEEGAGLIAKAEANLTAREEEAKSLGVIKTATRSIKVNPALVAKAEKEKAEKKAATSAKQAGKVPPKARAKQGPQATAH